MRLFPEKAQQIIQAHAGLINGVVQACCDRQLLPRIEPVLEASAANGWHALVLAIRKILAGTRDDHLLTDLDDEDRVIVEAILRGLRDPGTLPDPQARPDPMFAGLGLAGMIDAAAKGDVAMLALVGEMVEQMRRVGGDMARVAAAVSRMVDGEREPSRLCHGMGGQARSLALQILEELAKLNPH